MIPRARIIVPILVVLAAVVGLMIWLFVQTSDKGSRTQAQVPSTHSVFGEIHETSARDFSEIPVVQGPTGPLPKTPVFLVLGNHLLEWSAADMRPKKHAGYLYFRDPKSVWKPVSNSKESNVWAFAACTKSQLADVASNDLSAVFCAAGDLDKGRTSFGTNRMQKPADNAIRVREGEVILARHSAEPSKIYAVELTRQDRGRLQAQYVEIGE
jgi:hypothetical protein